MATAEKRQKEIRGFLLPGLRRERKAQLLDQGELAKMSGLSRATISLLEGGDRGALKPTLLAIARALEVDPKELTRGDDRNR